MSLEYLFVPKSAQTNCSKHDADMSERHRSELEMNKGFPLVQSGTI